jgi:hypothetical protein
MRRTPILRLSATLALGSLLVGSGCSSDDADDAVPTSSTADPAGGAVDGIDGVRVVPAESRDHVETPVAYPTAPPAGGAHFPAWQNCGFYTVEVPDETAVHSLEHGAVWVTYRSDVDASELAGLEALATRETHVLATPYEQASPFVVTAWEHQLDLDSLTDPRLEQFLAAYLEQGPEPGAPCSGAIGVPPEDATGS